MNILLHKKPLLWGALLAFSTISQAAVTVIDFDNDSSGAAINAPNLFSGATALTELYAAKGVHFTALERNSVTSQVPHNGVLKTITRNELSPSTSGMGAILNDGSGFGKAAKSGDNFLAFNGETAYGSHFWRISFDNPIGFFEIDRLGGANPNNAYYLNLDAYDSDGNLVGSKNNLYSDINSWSSDGYYGRRPAFKSETMISYVDLGQAMDYGSGNRNSGLRPTPWAMAYDNLTFGDFADASAGVGFLSGGGGSNVPLPAAGWLFITAFMGLLGFSSRRKG